MKTARFVERKPNFAGKRAFHGVIIAFLKSSRPREDVRRHHDVEKMTERDRSDVIGVLHAPKWWKNDIFPLIILTIINAYTMYEFEFIGVLRHMQQYFSHIHYVTAQMCRRTEEEVVPPVGLPTP